MSKDKRMEEHPDLPMDDMMKNMDKMMRRMPMEHDEPKRKKR